MIHQCDTWLKQDGLQVGNTNRKIGRNFQNQEVLWEVLRHIVGRAKAQRLMI